MLHLSKYALRSLLCLTLFTLIAAGCRDYYSSGGPRTYEEQHTTINQYVQAVLSQDELTAKSVLYSEVTVSRSDEHGGSITISKNRDRFLSDAWATLPFTTFELVNRTARVISNSESAVTGSILIETDSIRYRAEAEILLRRDTRHHPPGDWMIYKFSLSNENQPSLRIN